MVDYLIYYLKFTILFFFFNLCLIKYTSKKYVNFFFFSSIFFIFFNFHYFKLNIINKTHLSGTFMLVCIIQFVYAGLLKSISVKFIFDLKKKSFTVNEYFKVYKKQSFLYRIKNLIDLNFLKKNKNLYLSKKKLWVYQKFIIQIHKIFKIKFSG